MPVTEDVSIKQSRFGKGLFANKCIDSNTVICKVEGRQLTFQQTLSLQDLESHCLQIGKDEYILCEPPFLYSNHSCEPNCALNNKLELFTLRPIHAGEELLWDYSTSMLEKHWTMKCSCGQACCRKLITDFDLLPEDLQMKYLHLNIVLPYIVNELKKAVPNF